MVIQRPGTPLALCQEASLLARALMAAAPSFVLSANRIAFAVEHEAGIVEAFEVLRQRPGGVLQVRNGFNKKARVGDECRSLQVWVPVKTDRYGPLLAGVLGSLGLRAGRCLQAGGCAGRAG